MVYLLQPVVLLHSLDDLLGGVEASTLQLGRHVIDLGLRVSLLMIA